MAKNDSYSYWGKGIILCFLFNTGGLDSKRLTDIVFSRFDNVLKLVINKSGDMEILGELNIKIWYNKEMKHWRLECKLSKKKYGQSTQKRPFSDRLEPKVFATSDSLFSTFITGTHNWKFYNHPCHEQGQLVKITITACRKG